MAERLVRRIARLLRSLAGRGRPPPRRPRPGVPALHPLVVVLRARRGRASSSASSTGRRPTASAASRSPGSTPSSTSSPGPAGSARTGPRRSSTPSGMPRPSAWAATSPSAPSGPSAARSSRRRTPTRRSTAPRTGRWSRPGSRPTRTSPASCSTTWTATPWPATPRSWGPRSPRRWRDARRPCSATRGRSPPGGCGRRSSGTGSASGSATTCASIVDRLDEDEHARYDYRAFIADAVLDEFYRPFTEICHGLGAVSRVQCHGAPTDLIAAYGAVDVPETEVLLFPPPFARIAASAAALGGKPVVSCETFTCPYGFPAVHFKQERASDLRLLADAAIAHGVNQVVWHGMPYNPPGGSNAFFATTHVGPDSALAAEIPALNAYLADVCSWMRRGRTYAGLAVYLPVEDNRMRDRLPPELRTPAAQFYWELRQEVVPEEAEPYGPLWVSAASLVGATWDGSKLRVGAAEFDALLLACRWLDVRGAGRRPAAGRGGAAGGAAAPPPAAGARGRRGLRGEARRADGPAERPPRPGRAGPDAPGRGRARCRRTGRGSTATS